MSKHPVNQAARRPERGRPNRPLDKARSERVVTFVTKRDLETLQQTADDAERSLSAVVRRIIVQHLRSKN